MSLFVHHVEASNAAKIADWMKNRGGILIWSSINLSNPGASWTTPVLTEDGKPYQKPTWQAGNTPRVVITMDQVAVFKSREVKRFHVATYVSDFGLTSKVTDGGSRRIRAEVSKAEEKYGVPAWHEFDYGSEKNAVILVEDGTQSLEAWLLENSRNNSRPVVDTAD